MNQSILDIKNLSVSFTERASGQLTSVINDISFQLNASETLGIIGESGSGKSMTLLSIMGLVEPKPGIISGAITLNTGQSPRNLLNNIEQHVVIKNDNIHILNEKKWHINRENNYHKIRGKVLSMIFQNPRLAFNPYYSIGRQINEMIRLHTPVKCKKEAKRIAINWLARVNMEAPELRYNNNPYGLSGGMCQRAMIAMALASQPNILIADEPTTGLDASIQSSIIHLLQQLKVESDVSMIVVSHDLNVIQQLSDRVLVYYQGQIIEQGNTHTVFNKSPHSQHPYTKQLIAPHLSCKIKNSAEIVDDKNACAFIHRCPLNKNEIIQLCQTKKPPLFHVGENHKIRCWKYQND